MESILSEINSGNDSLNPGMYFDINQKDGFGTQNAYPNVYNLNGIPQSELIPKSSSKPFIDVNGFIQYTHSASAYNDQSEQYITTGTIVMTERQIDPYAPRLSADMSLSRFNECLRVAHEDYLLDIQNTNSSPDSVAFERFMAVPGAEKKLSDYGAALYDTDTLGFDDEIRKIYAIAMKTEYRYLTKTGILKHFNYMGVAMTTGTSQNMAAINERGYEPSITNINICVSKRARVANIWGGKYKVRAGAKLFLVLRKQSDGSYMIQPDIKYGGVRPLTLDGHVWYVGIVKFGARRDPSSASVQKVIRSRTNETAFKSLGTLELIDVNLGF